MDSNHPHRPRDIHLQLADIERRQRYRRRRIVDSPQGRTLRIEGRELLNFCSNDYLGLAADPRLAAAFKRGIDRWGCGSGAAHLISGHTAAHHELEAALADFTGRQRALLFGSGYAANMGTINGLLTVGDKIYQDRLNHASLLDGGWLSRADVQWFAHRDYRALEQLLATTTHTQCRRLVVSDGTFSMDGDQCDLPVLIQLCRSRDALLMIDDAHGFGVHGYQGQGLAGGRKTPGSDVPLLMGTLGKAFGCAGAFVAADEALIELLVQKARHYIYSTAMPAAVAVAALESLRIVKEEQWRRDKLTDLIQHFRRGAKAAGLNVAESFTPIQPLLLFSEQSALWMSAQLELQGLLVTAIRPPTVPAGTSRLRITLSANHERADIDRLLSVLTALNAATVEPDHALG